MRSRILYVHPMYSKLTTYSTVPRLLSKIFSKKVNGYSKSVGPET